MNHTINSPAKLLHGQTQAFSDGLQSTRLRYVKIVQILNATEIHGSSGFKTSVIFHHFCWSD